MASQNAPVSSAQNTPQETPKSLKKNVADFIGRTWKSSTHDLGSIKDRLQSSKEGLQSLYEKCCFRENHVENEEEQESLKSKIGSAFSKNLTKSSAKIASFSRGRIFPIFHKSRNSEEVVQNWMLEITEMLHSSDKERQIENLQRFIDRVCSPKGEKILIKEYKRSAGDLSSRTLLQNFALDIIKARMACHEDAIPLFRIETDPTFINAQAYIKPLFDLEANVQGLSMPEKHIIRQCFGINTELDLLQLNNIKISVPQPIDKVSKEVIGQAFIDKNPKLINKSEVKKQLEADLKREFSSGDVAINGIRADKDKVSVDFDFIVKTLGVSPENEQLALKALVFFQQGAYGPALELAKGLSTDFLKPGMSAQFRMSEGLITSHDNINVKDIRTSRDKETVYIEIERVFRLNKKEENTDSFYPYLMQCNAS
ncbi:hypothetical protein ACTFIY_004551 [Dictyostelium cf. discoideum]